MAVRKPDKYIRALNTNVTHVVDLLDSVVDLLEMIHYHVCDCEEE